VPSFGRLLMSAPDDLSERDRSPLREIEL